MKNMISNLINKRREGGARAVCEDAVKKRERVPRFALILLGIAALSLVLYIVMRASVPFADLFNTYISSVFRAALAHLTSWYPVSVAETMLLLLPLAVTGLIMIAVKHYCVSWKSVCSYILSVLSVASVAFSLFVFTFAAGYNGRTVDEKLGIERDDVTAEELYDTALILSGCINEELDSIYFSCEGHSDMMYTFEEMNDKLMEAYDKLCDEHSFIQRLDSRAKPVLLSEPWMYTHISGIYTFFTGEANFNTVLPDYTIPYTVAHELAHQRGISREDEANLIAFLVCEYSDDPYIRYSGYVNMFQYVTNALYSADRDLYTLARATLDSRVTGEFRAYREFFKKYENNTIAAVSDKINETSIKLQGSRSYGMVVDLTVAYYKDKAE